MRGLLLASSLLIAVLSVLICLAIRAEAKYPRLEYMREYGELDLKLKQLYTHHGIRMDDGHRFDIVKTDSGYDIILHFLKESDE